MEFFKHLIIFKKIKKKNFKDSFYHYFIIKIIYLLHALNNGIIR